MLVIVALTMTSWLTGWLAGDLARGLVGVGSEEAATPAPAIPSSTSAVAQPAASPACLEAASRADGLIDLLRAGRRDRAADLLVAYTVASRQCRHDASPERAP
jgi:hypothetical protein